MDSRQVDTAWRNPTEFARGTGTSLVLRSFFAAAVLALSGSVACGDELAARVYVRGLTSPTEQDTGLHFTPDGDRILATGSRWRFFQAMPPFAFVKEHPIPPGFSVFTRSSQIYSVATDGVTIYDPADLSVRKKLTYNHTEDHRGGGYLALSSDEKLLAFGTNRGLYVLDADTMKLVTEYSINKYANSCAFLRFVDDDKKLIAAWTKTADYTPVGSKIIDVAQGTAEKFPHPIAIGRHGRGLAAVSPDRRTVAIREDQETRKGDEQSGTFLLVDARTLDVRWRASADVKPSKFAFSPDGLRILTNGHPALRTENGERAASAFSVLDANTGKLLLTMPADMPDIKPAINFAFSPDGKTLATCPHDPENRVAPIVLWDWKRIEAELLMKPEP